MPNRRVFLKTTLLATTVPVLAYARATLAGDDGLCVVVDGACSDRRRFAAHCALTPLNASEPAEVLRQLAHPTLRGCCGLTRDSDYFLIEQMAGAFGYRRGYHGVHDYRAGRLCHQLTGARSLLNELAQVLRVAGADWAVPLASAVPALSRAAARSARLEIQGDSLRPADSGGYLVSWCLHRA